MAKPIRRVAVVGTGILGTQIAIQAAMSGYDVSTYDTDGEALNRAFKNLYSIIGKGGKSGTASVMEWEEGLQKVKHFSELGAALQDADLVIEAAPEILELKRALFEKIDALAPLEAILATNSSSIPISKIETATRRPERCLNIHFYFPAMGMNMVDLMGGSKTTPEVMEAGKGWVRSIGCVPLTVKKEILGFCFNRVWRAVKREALHMWAGGFVDFRDIDRAWMIFTGMPQGPFGLMDKVGLDVVYDIEMVYYDESKDPKDRPPDLLKQKVDRKELGVKTGEGFYRYPDPEFGRADFMNPSD
jgi:3-hydroxybutyryl-CoA dehydrogenase